MGSSWQLRKGSFTLGNYRFQIDPSSYPEGGQQVELPQQYVRGLGSGGETQSWAASYSDNVQTFTWESMPETMYDEIYYYKQQSILDRDLTFSFIYHNKSPEETWDIVLIDFTGTKIAGVYYGVSLSIRLIEQL